MVLDQYGCVERCINRGQHYRQIVILLKSMGGQKTSETIAAIATIVGSFVFPPFGIILVPFLAVLVSELIIQKDIMKATKVGFATIIGFLGGSLAKVLIQLLMIVWFILAVIFLIICQPPQ